MTPTLLVLAAASPSPTPAKGGEGVKSGPIGLAVILVLCVAAYFLFKSMSKHMRKVREQFPTDAAENPKHVMPPTAEERPEVPQPPAETPPRSSDPP